MKALFKILIVATFIGIIVYYTNVEPSKTEVLEGPTTITKPVVDVASPQKNLSELPRPTSGISTYIGKSSEEIMDNFGKPNRIDPSEFGYEWWIYNNYIELFMIGVKDDTVTQIFTTNKNINTDPYKIGQSLEDIYRMTIFEEEVTVELEENLYMFAMNERDMQNRILVRFDDVYMQLYIDNETNELYGVRFIDGETLVLHQSYEMQFVGELLEASTPSSYTQIEIDLANGRQLTEITNVFRKKNEMAQLQFSNVLTSLAGENSEQMFQHTMESQVVEEKFELKQLLEQLAVDYKQVGENIATNYKDSIEVFHGWINSKDHRAQMLTEQYTQIGSGAYVNFYTQYYME